MVLRRLINRKCLRIVNHFPIQIRSNHSKIFFNILENSGKTSVQHKKANLSAWISGAMVVGTALILQYSFETSNSNNIAVEKKVPEKASSNSDSSSKSTSEVNMNLSPTSETTFENFPPAEDTTTTKVTAGKKDDDVDDGKKQSFDKESDNNSKKVSSDDNNTLPDLGLPLTLTWFCFSILADMMSLRQNVIFQLGLTLAEKIVFDGSFESSIVLDTPRRLTNEELVSKGPNSSSESNTEDLSNITTDRVKNFLEACQIPFVAVSSSSSLSTVASETPPSKETLAQPVVLSSVSAADSGTIRSAASAAETTNPTSAIMHTNKPCSRDLFIRSVVNNFLWVCMQMSHDLTIYNIITSPMTNRTIDELEVVVSYPMSTMPEYIEKMARTLKSLNDISTSTFQKSIGDWCVGTHIETKNLKKYNSPESELVTKLTQLVGVAIVSYYIAQKFTSK